MLPKLKVSPDQRESDPYDSILHIKSYFFGELLENENNVQTKQFFLVIFRTLQLWRMTKQNNCTCQNLLKQLNNLLISVTNATFTTVITKNVNMLNYVIESFNNKIYCSWFESAFWLGYKNALIMKDDEQERIIIKTIFI